MSGDLDSWQLLKRTLSWDAHHFIGKNFFKGLSKEKAWQASGPYCTHDAMGSSGPLHQMEFDRHRLGRAVSCSAVVINHISLLYCGERATLERSSPAMVVFLLGNSDVCVYENIVKSANFKNRLGFSLMWTSYSWGETLKWFFNPSFYTKLTVFALVSFLLWIGTCNVCFKFWSLWCQNSTSDMETLVESISQAPFIECDKFLLSVRYILQCRQLQRSLSLQVFQFLSC